MVEVTVALIAAAGLLLTQALLHRRWTREQDNKRREAMDKATEQRRQEAREQAKERRQEQADVLGRISEQTENVVTQAMQLLEIHRNDAEGERGRTALALQAHNDCRQEVAEVRGQVQELRIRMEETERTAGFQTRMAELHGALKHDALNALAAAEGSLLVAARAAERGDLQMIQDLFAEYTIKGPQLVEENKQVHQLARQLLEEGHRP